MNAQLTDEQERIQQTLEEFIKSHGGIELARRRMDGETEVIDELWNKLAELDYPAITVPDEYDGLGEGMLYLTALLEISGKYALPGPLPETAAFSVPLINQLGTSEQKEKFLPPTAAGDIRWSFALYDDRTEPLPDAIQLEATSTEGGYTLNGTKTLVPYGGEVDSLIVAARTQHGSEYGGISLFVVDTEPLMTSELQSLDRVRPMYEVEFSEVTVSEDRLLGPIHGAGSTLESAIDRFTIAGCAMLVGAADRAVSLSAEHGKEREQYGQPVGRFQAVKHRIVDMWVDMQASRSLVYYAAWALENDDPAARRLVASTKTYAADRLNRVFGDGMKNHGGMGFTWDHDGHIYLKQAKAWRNFLGSPEEYADALIDARL
jgi:alkylation response protein AidB-like acyl-CoA dehydrogenase